MTDLINSFLSQANSLHLLVIGDLMLDQYLWGKMDRISPEAPVPIVDIYQQERRLGGAANAALNIISMGASCSICGIIGQDEPGKSLQKLAKDKLLNTDLVYEDPHRKTTQKTRIICSGQQVLRVDEEEKGPLEAELIRKIWYQIKVQLPTFDGVIFSDYDKGFLGEFLIKKIIQACNENNIPSMVDPKFNNFWAYEGCTLFKPNLKELETGLAIQLDKSDYTSLKEAITLVRERMPHEQSLVTLSEYGMILLNKLGEEAIFPAHRREIVDVSGAGDAVMAVAALALAGGLSSEEASLLANIAGGLVCEEVGVVPVQVERLKSAILSPK